MPDYTRTTELPVDAATAFAYLGEVENLPRYFPRITEVERTEGDKVDTTAVVEDPDDPGEQRTEEGEAWFHADAGSRQVRWGAPGPNDYHGQLDLTDADEGRSTLAFTLHTEDEFPGVEEAIDETLATISANLGADAT